MHGALFGGLRAEFLLDFESFLQFKGMQHTLPLERDFPKLSAYAWMTVIYQIIKIFVLSRVSTKSLKGTSDTKQSVIFPKNNMMGTSELILLKWLQHLCKKVIGYITDLIL
jgi:hypothetical protein